MENFLQRLLRFYPLQAPSKVFRFLVLFLLVAAVPFTVYLVNQQQEIRSRAQSSSSTYFGNSKVSPALLDFGSVDKSKPEATQYLTIEYVDVSSSVASTSKITPTSAFGALLFSKSVSFALSPSTQSETVGSTFSAQLFLDVGTNNITGVDVTIKYNKDVLEVNGFEARPVFNTQLINNFDNQSGALHYSAVNTQGSVGGTVNVGTITFRAKAQGTSSVTIENVQITAIGQNESLKTSNNPIGSYAVASAAPSVYSLSLKKSIPGANIAFSENQFSLKKGENKPVQATLSIDPNTIKEGAYSNEVILTIGNNNYSIPLNFTYSMPLIAKLGPGVKATPRAQENTKEEKESPKFKGYIVELKKDPIVEYKKKAEAEGKITALGDYANILSKEHEDAKKDILSRLGKGQEEISAKEESRGEPSIMLREYTTVFNGMALDITDEQAEKIKKESPYVKDVHPNYEVKALLNESVPLINAGIVWQSLRDDSGRPITGQGVIIAIIDTGIDYTHPDLGGCLGNTCKVIGDYDFANQDSDPMDDSGHGTHVAAIAAGDGFLKGVAPGAKLVAYKVLGSDGSGSSSNVIAAIERATQFRLDGDLSNNIDIINLSLGKDCYSYDTRCGPDDPISRAVDNATDGGMVVVIAAGNSGPNPRTIGSPGTARKAITVGAATKTIPITIAGFSSRGPVVVGGETVNKPDVVDPGVGICAAEANGFYSYRRCIDDRHIELGGTSMATPHVAGVVALLKQKYPAWLPGEIKAVLKNRALDLGYDVNTQGSGMVNAFVAVSGPSVTPIPPPPATFLFSVKFPGIGKDPGENRNPRRIRRRAQLHITNRNMRIFRELDLTYDNATGQFKGELDVADIFSGTGFVFLRFDNTLVKVANITVLSHTRNQVPQINLIPGSAVFEERILIQRIDSQDRDRLVSCFGSTLSSSNWGNCESSDFNDDGRISVVDYSRLIANFGRVDEAIIEP